MAASLDELLRERDHGRALEAAYRRFAGSLLRYACRFAANQEAAEEVVHDVFLQFIAGKFEGEREEDLKSWLFVVARNRCLDQIKKSKRERADGASVEAAVCARDLAAEAERRDLERVAAAAAARLPADLAEPWRLRALGLDNAEIARRLGVPVGTVKSRFFRLVERLKEELNGEA